MIFISHSSRDDAFVDDIRRSLVRMGYTVWVDHHDIPAGKHWDDVVEDALRRSFALILVLSPDAVKSRNVKVEWHEFRDLDRPIVPVRVRECVVPLLIRHLNYIDFTLPGRYEDKLERVVKSLPIGMGRGTRELDVNAGDLELSHVKHEVQRLQLEMDSIVGEDQMLLAFPRVKKSIMIDLDREKLFVGCQIKWTDSKPDIDLTRFDAADSGVSRQHMLLTRNRTGLTVTDLGSLNGTHVDRKRIEPYKPIFLRNRSVLHIGKLAAQVFFRLSGGAH